MPTPPSTNSQGQRDDGWRRIENGPTTASIGVDGLAIAVRPGESLAAALLTAGFTTLRRSPAALGPRSVFCFMGSCQECLVHVDGIPLPACMVPVRAGMQVTTDSFMRERRATADTDPAR